MKTQTSWTRILVFSAMISVALLATACGNSAQQQAYERAAQMEEKFTPETAPAIIAEYRKVIAIEPGSSLAKKSQQRITTVEARMKAEEQRKDVFQEHGVD